MLREVARQDDRFGFGPKPKAYPEGVLQNAYPANGLVLLKVAEHPAFAIVVEPPHFRNILVAGVEVLRNFLPEKALVAND